MPVTQRCLCFLVFFSQKPYISDMEVTQTARTEDSHTPVVEEIWAILQNVSKINEETACIVKRTARRQKENERQMKESKADFNRRLGEYINLFGEFTESMIAPGLRDKFREMGIDFEETSRDTVIHDAAHNIHLEIDVFLKNGDKAMLVEVKTKLTIERVNKHIERLEKMRKYADLHGDKRAFLGAVAGVVVTDEERNYALNQGLYVIEPSGETFNITPPNGQPKEW